MDFSFISFISDSLLSAFCTVLDFLITTFFDLLFVLLDYIPAINFFDYIPAESIEYIYEKLEFCNLFFPVYETFIIAFIFLNSFIVLVFMRLIMKFIPFIG